MKKFVLASVMAMASIGLVYAPSLRAQDSTITIKDPAEFNAYTAANQVTDPKAQAAALESFLTTYPQTVVKKSVLSSLIDLYQGLRDVNNTLSAASRLLQVDPANLGAIYYSVLIKKSQCAKSNPVDTQTCDDTAVLAQKGLAAPKPADTKDDEWKKLTGGIYPVFHSAIALDDIVSKKDYKGGISEYRTESMLYPPECRHQHAAHGIENPSFLRHDNTLAQPSSVTPPVTAWKSFSPIRPLVDERKMALRATSPNISKRARRPISFLPSSSAF